jgi:signal transduction histidine kinase
MSADKTILKKTATALVPDQAFDPARHIAPGAAHELNNILTIVQGYADRLLLRHAHNPALMPELKLISEAARRAATVIRNARPINANETFQRDSRAPQVQA